jgi:hypothetical protein
MRVAYVFRELGAEDAMTAKAVAMGDAGHDVVLVGAGNPGGAGLHWVRPDPPRPGISTSPAFVGAAVTRDGWHRLGRAVHAKARQSSGALPVWLRIDALDGFFQFTEWPALEWPERIKRVATTLRGDRVRCGRCPIVVESRRTWWRRTSRLRPRTPPSRAGQRPSVAP